MEIKRIGVLSLGKILALFGLVAGIFSVILTKVVCLSDATVATQYGLSCVGYSFWQIILGILVSGVSYFVAGIVLAALYNLFVQWVGGVVLDSEGKSSKKKKK